MHNLVFGNKVTTKDIFGIIGKNINMNCILGNTIVLLLNLLNLITYTMTT